MNRLLKRVRDHAQVHGSGVVDLAAVREAMTALDVDDEGLDSSDRRVLVAIVTKFGGGPVGVNAIAAVLAEEVETIEDVIEPFLLRLGFLDRTPQGRVVTEAGREHLRRQGIEVPPAAAGAATCGRGAGYLGRAGGWRGRAAQARAGRAATEA